MSNENTIFANPTKAFFVRMLTRDIELSDAILYLLDNCVDGIVRQQKKPSLLQKPARPLTRDFGRRFLPDLTVLKSGTTAVASLKTSRNTLHL